MNKFLFSRLIALSAIFFGTPAWSVEIHVPADFTSIQGAINAAQDGDVVILAPGSYFSSTINITKPITLRGAETARTLMRIDLNTPKLAINTSGAGPGDVTITGFTFVDSFSSSIGAAISVDGGTNINIINNVFRAGPNRTGVVVNDPASTVNISNNTFFGNGIAVNRLSDQVSIRNNIFAGNATTIIAGPSEDAIAYNCFADAGESSGTDTAVGDPLFVNTDAIPPNNNFITIPIGDFHLQAGSPCIDAGDPADDDVIDETRADAGVYGGPFADPRPYPVSGLAATAVPTVTPEVYDIELSWDPNLSYLTERYFVHYSPTSGPPYAGDSAPSPSPIDVGNVTAFTLSKVAAAAIIPAAPIATSSIRGDPNAAILGISDQIPVINWETVSGANGYRVYYGTSSLNENQKEVGANIVGVPLSSIEPGVTYRAAVTAIYRPSYYLVVTNQATLLPGEDAETKQSIFSSELEVTVSTGDPIESPFSNELRIQRTTTTPLDDVDFSGLDGCFIATAAFGHYSEPRVQLLRDFRDAYLLPSAAGQAFVKWYYRYSPNVAVKIADHEWVKLIVRILLLPLIGFSFLMLQFGPVLTGVIALLMVVGIYLCRFKFLPPLQRRRLQ